MDLSNYIYLDNNANTIISDATKDEIYKWMNTGNASSTYAEEFGTKSLIERFKLNIAKMCEFDLNDYTIIINSGASESNNFILRSTTASYIFHKRKQPHVIVSATEHKSLLECAKSLKDEKIIELTIVKPNKKGKITINEIKNVLQSNTCLVCVMHSNNETGIINEVDYIGAFLASRNPSIPFYVDCVQTFGKFPVRPSKRNITAFCASFHKLGGPIGIGVFVGYTNFVKGYKLHPEICGSQNNGMRGGTENIPYIAGAFSAMKETFLLRDKKNKDLFALQLYTLRYLMNNIPTSFYEDWEEENLINITGHPNYKGTGEPPQVEMVVFGSNILDPQERYKYIIPNTLLLSFIKHKTKKNTTNISENFVEGGGNPSVNARPICNFMLAAKLKEANIIVGLGSACNTGHRSHVLDAMDVPDVVANGTIRVSYGDKNVPKDSQDFVRELLFAIKALL
jgi:cysteine desulfurase